VESSLSEPRDAEPTTRSADRPQGDDLAETQPSGVELQAWRVAGVLNRLIPDVVAAPSRNYVRVVVPTEDLEAAARLLRDELG